MEQTTKADLTEDTGELEMTIYCYMEAVIAETFDIELELLQGKRTFIGGGKIHIVATIPPEKTETIRSYILFRIANSQNQINLS